MANATKDAVVLGGAIKRRRDTIVLSFCDYKFCRIEKGFIVVLFLVFSRAVGFVRNL
jgi:hypothetical protein